MLKKIVYWLLGFTLVLLLAVGAGLWWLDGYLAGNQEKLLEDYLDSKGLSVAMRNVNVELWDHFPDVIVEVDSIVVRDLTHTVEPAPLLNAQRIEANISLRDMLRGRIGVEDLVVYDTQLNLHADSTGAFNTGYWMEADSTDRKEDGGGPSLVSLKYEGLCATLRRVDFSFVNEFKGKEISTYINDAEVVVDRTPENHLRVDTRLDLDVGTLLLKAEKGGYLRETPVKGNLRVIFGDSLWIFDPTVLEIGDQFFQVSAKINKDSDSISNIFIASDSITWEPTVAILNSHLQDKVKDFYVDGHLPVAAEIMTPLSGGPTNVDLDFKLDGHFVKIKQYTFEHVTTPRARFTTRTELAQADIPKNKKNVLVMADSVSGLYLEKILVETPAMEVAVDGKDPIMTAFLRASGPSSGVSDYLKNDDFFFDGGRFLMTANVVESSMLDWVEMVNRTDGQMLFIDTKVRYAPAGVVFPFDAIETVKLRQDITFDIRTAPLAGDVSIDMSGYLDNIVPLIVDQPGAQINTALTMHAPRLDWTDFRALFGQDGQFSEVLGGEEEGADAGAGPGASGAMAGDSTNLGAEQVAAMKSTLLGLREEFNPNINIALDTVGYYDVFTLQDFKSGLHFDADTLILERTSFTWAGSEMNFGARLALDVPTVTPFSVDFLAENLDLNATRPALDYFGVAIPKEVNELPRDMRIDFTHSGRIADSIGIVPGYNSGSLKFDDGRAQLFSGNLRYRPGPEGLWSRVDLQGDPRVVNVLFSSENFFFGEGHFSLDMELDRTPSTVPELIEYGRMNLRIDSSRIHYKPTDVFIPIRQFNVDVLGENVEYYLSLVTDSTNRQVTIEGGLDRFSRFMFPDSTATDESPMVITADVRAQSLGYTDLNEFFQSPADTLADRETVVSREGRKQRRVRRDSSAVARTDTVSSDSSQFDISSALSTTGSVFNSFRPNLSLRVDTFWLASPTPLTDVATGMRVRGEDELVLERTGFTYKGGRVELDATYRLDDQPRSPFQANWRVDNLNAGDLLTEFELLGPQDSTQSGTAEGIVFFTGNVNGLLDESTSKIDIAGTNGTVDVSLEDLSAAGWPGLVRTGKKALMAHRFDTIAASPIAATVTLRDGVAYLPRTEIQSTALQVFIEGRYDTEKGQDILVSVPVFANLFRGDPKAPPAKTGYAGAGWKIFLVMTVDEDGEPATKFRLGRRKYYKERGRLAEFREMKRREKTERRAKRKKR